MKKILIPIIIVLLNPGCKKDVEDKQAPVITITSPADQQVFTDGQTVTITATVSDNDEIHEVNVTVTNAASNTVVLEAEDHADSQTYNVNQTFVVQAGNSYKIEIDATDHNDNAAKVQKTISAM